LLEVARETLLALLPQVEPSHHYALRMVANAMAIAGRECAAGNAKVLDVEARRLRDAIRAGTADGEPVHAELRALTQARVAISNPRLLLADAKAKPR
jgi:hypothetical protein